MSHSEDFDPYRKWLGIPKKFQPPNHYRLLGVGAFEDDPDVIDSAANARMAHLRTFQNSKRAALSQQLLNEISAARICLLTPEKRQTYDAQLKAELLSKKRNKQSSEQEVPVGTLEDDAAPADPDVIAVGPKQRRVSTIARRRKKKSATMPIAISVGSVAILIVVVVIFISANSKDDGDSGAEKDKGKSESEAKLTDANARDKFETTRDRSKDRDRLDPSIRPLPIESKDKRNPDAKDKMKIHDPPSTGPAPRGRRDVADATTAAADLLAVLDLKKDVIKGDWSSEDSHLVGAGHAEDAVLQIPCRLASHYKLIATIEKTTDDGTFAIGLEAGGQQVSVVLDQAAGDARLSGLELIDDVPVRENTTKHDEVVFVSASPRTILCAVLDERIVVLSDDNVIVDWRGGFNTLSLRRGNEAGDAGQLWLAVREGEFRISALKIEPIGDPDAFKLPKPDPPPVVEKKRHPVPNDADVLAKTNEFAEPVARIVDEQVPSERKRLLEEMIARAKSSEDDPIVQFALLTTATALAAQFGEAEVALQAVRGQIEIFEMPDPLRTMADAAIAAARFADKSTTKRESARLAAEIAETAIAEKRNDLAVELLTQAAETLKESTDVESQKDFKKYSDRLAEIGSDEPPTDE